MISTTILFLIISSSIIRSQAAIATPNYGTGYNGIGAIPLILSKKAPPPGIHRVLMAMLLRYIPSRFWEPAYEIIMVLMLTIALQTANHLFSLPFALSLAALLPLTFRFDYWDWIPELQAALAATSGNFFLCLPSFFFSALSKETSPLLPIIFFCYHPNLPIYQTISLFLVTIIPIITILIIQGNITFDRQMIQRNANDLLWWYQNSFRNILFRSDMSSTILLTTLSTVAIIQLGFPIAIPWLIILFAGWILATAIETRVFTILLIPILQVIFQQIK
jgi:hypothetical protein